MTDTFIPRDMPRELSRDYFDAGHYSGYEQNHIPLPLQSKLLNPINPYAQYPVQQQQQQQQQQVYSMPNSLTPLASPLASDSRFDYGDKLVPSGFPLSPTHEKKKRPRRKHDEIERIYKCNWKGCAKGYGTLNHLNAHVLTQNHGPKRRPEEFKDIRAKLRERKRKNQDMMKLQRQKSGDVYTTEFTPDSNSSSPATSPNPAQPGSTSGGHTHHGSPEASFASYSPMKMYNGNTNVVPNYSSFNYNQAFAGSSGGLNGLEDWKNGYNYSNPEGGVQNVYYEQSYLG